ncbi:MAG: tRNA (guanosine(46)-N7)-methyltransferase TrmB [Arsenophonus sp.]|nr:MAG: tRNA (guanosine(46)-N7)-methyltransferase TrmB [Arsenophonus sp.]
MHHIHSFVLRNRKLNQKKQEIFKKLWPYFGLNFVNNPISIKEIFHNTYPVILEIGFGSGKLLIQTAKKNTKKNILGIEVYKKGIFSCFIQAEKENIKNLKIIYYDAISVLKLMIPNNSLSVIQIFFPDPWHKRKHHKRRMIKKIFLEILLKKLRNKGIIHIMTDCSSYANHIINNISLINDQKSYFPFLNNYIKLISNQLISKFESRAINKKNSIFQFFVQKNM